MKLSYNEQNRKNFCDEMNGHRGLLQSSQILGLASIGSASLCYYFLYIIYQKSIASVTFCAKYELSFCFPVSQLS